MERPIRVLHVEDNPRDAELVRSQLKAADIPHELIWVDRQESFASALATHPFDLILCDYNLPGFNGLAALRLARERQPDVPVIIITGVLTDEEAAKCLEAGATDYVLKDRVSRLGFAVMRSIQDAEQRRLRGLAEAALRESEERTRSLLEFAPDAFLIVDDAGRIQMANAAAERVFDYTRKELIGQPVEMLMPARYRQGHIQHRDMFGRSPQTREMGVGLELIGLRRDGREFPISVSLGSVEVGGKRLNISAVRDVSERHRLEEQLRQAQRMEVVGRLAGGVAHDFNNLLTVIIGVAELVLEQVKDGDPLRADLEEIHRAGERGALLTKQLLAFSRKQLLQPEVLNLNTVVAKMEGLLRRLIHEDIDLVVEGAQGLGSVKADPGQIEQVIANLAVNARDAMPQGGQLTIETLDVELDEDYPRQHGVAVRPGSYVMLAITDTGTGMDEATRARIFEPYFTTKASGKGTGLGLSTVFGIVKQSEGLIWVYSEVGRGTSFKIYLPRVAEVAGSTFLHAATGPTRGTETILVVEDEKGLRNLVARILQSAGYTVRTAADGKEALHELERVEGPVSLMITDVVMPGLSGPSLAEEAGRIRSGIKVLYMSGYTDDTVMRHRILDERLPFIGKPFTAVALGRKVREVLDSKD
ncbi:MAG: hypothetical protein A3J29_22490 [Acidobacteria bacterium RIFCSPLOWO2_12_FULL_67_14b]|nr:MAG: hypothetical protein A3J29_22490 [Acidobacteria bacterium RIFCSPLOWO2_12_FULL_67_14b]